MKKQRCRVIFSKTSQMRFTGHLDLLLTWERTFRRAGLPLAYSEGYTPRPQINLAAPLPLGFISQGEIGDFWLSNALPVSEIRSQLESALPPGLEVLDIHDVPNLFGSKLPSLVTASSYSVFYNRQLTDAEYKIKKLLKSTSISWSRRGKSFNLRELIIKVEYHRNNDSKNDQVSMKLVHLPGATGRPEDVIRAMDLADDVNVICRTKIFLNDPEELL